MIKLLYLNVANIPVSVKLTNKSAFQKEIFAQRIVFLRIFMMNYPKIFSCGFFEDNLNFHVLGLVEINDADPFISAIRNIRERISY